MVRYLSILLILGFSIQPASALKVYAADSTDVKQSAVWHSDPYMTKEFNLSNSGMLKVFTTGGNIDVIPSSSAQKVKVELYIDRGFAFWSNANNLDNFRITMMQRDNEIVASVERKKRDTGFFSDRMNFSFRVYVPESISTELNTRRGDIKLENVRGEQAVKTGEGNISLRNITGQLKAYSSDGNIDISNSQGTIFVQTEGGNITLNRSSGEIRLRTGAGDIISERISGTMLARVKSGDIRADFMRVGEGINLEASTGDIQLSVPDHTGYELLLKATEVSFTDLDKVQGSINSGRVKGIYKDSGPPINLVTNTGTISLKIK